MKRLSSSVLFLGLLAIGFAFADQGASQVTQGLSITRNGSQPSQKRPASSFTGTVRLDPLFKANAPSRASGGLVTIEPGARSAWHTHPLGQTIIVTAGLGRVQCWGGPVEGIRPGDVI